MQRPCIFFRFGGVFKTKITIFAPLRNKFREVAQAGSAWRLRRQGRRKGMVFKTYILWSSSLQRFYVGSTNSLEDRLLRHNSGQGKFTSKGMPWVMIWSFDCVDRKEAFNLEYKIKSRGIRRFLEDKGVDLKKVV